MFDAVCAQCGARVTAAVSSEHVNERCVKYLWSCEACGYEFETQARFTPLSKSWFQTNSAEPQRNAAD